MSCTIGLLVLGIGYLVFASGSKEKEGMKILGQIIGILMMVGALGSVMYSAKCKMGEGCPFSKAPMCPMSMKGEQHQDHQAAAKE